MNIPDYCDMYIAPEDLPEVRKSLEEYKRYLTTIDAESQEHWLGEAGTERIEWDLEYKKKECGGVVISMIWVPFLTEYLEHYESTKAKEIKLNSTKKLKSA